MIQEFTVEFQYDLLKYLTRAKDMKIYVKILDSSIFGLSEHQFIFSLIQSYQATYFVTPKKNSLKQFFISSVKDKQVDDQTIEYMSGLIDGLYMDCESNDEFLKETVIDFAKRQMVRAVMLEYADKINDMADSDYVSLLSKLKKISDLGRESESLVPGRYLFKDFTLDRAVTVAGVPFFLKGVNQLTAARGFHTPQVVIFLAAPKGFKTGTMLNAAVDFAIYQRKKVLYCDTENGIQQLVNRSYQQIVSCTYDDLVSSKFDDKLEHTAAMALKLGGELRFEYFPPTVSTLDDVESKIAELAEDGFVPDIIFYDYFDKFGSNNRKAYDKRLVIQDVYEHAVRINMKHSTFAISVSQVKQSAVGKAVITMTDFGEDFAKAANSHAAFAICRTQWELDNGYAHIIPVVQRQGQRYKPGENEVFVRINEETMLIQELGQHESSKLREVLGLDISEAVVIASADDLDDR